MAKPATKKPTKAQMTQAAKKFEAFLAAKMEKSAPKVKAERKKLTKYQLLHVPSGQHLKLGNTGYAYQETKKAVFGYTKLWKLIKTLIFCYNGIDLARYVPLFESSHKPVDICIPGTSTIIGNYNLNALNRCDYVDINEGVYPDDEPYANASLSTLHSNFLVDPYFYFYTKISTQEVEQYLDDEEGWIRYKVLCQDTTSWDTIMLELFKHLQETGFSIRLKQFSKTGTTPERILLTEFEIVTVEV